MQVALFITCLGDTFFPRAGIACVKVLEHLGCTVSFPKGQTCCGQPLYNNGYHRDTKDLAKRMIETFESAEHVVTPSGSCAAMIRDYYVDLLKDEPDWVDRAKKLEKKTFEFVEFLVNELKVDLTEYKAKWEGTVTYHYSCHLRGIGVTDEAVRLMKQIEGLEYKPLTKMEQCCGFGGTFALKYPQISGTMVRDKVECIRSTNAPIVVSNDGGCTMNIAGACRRNSCDVGFKTLAEIVAEGMDLMPVDVPQPVTVDQSKGISAAQN